MAPSYEFIGAPFDFSANERGSARAPEFVRRAYVSRWQRRFETSLGITLEDGGDVAPNPDGAEESTVLDALSNFAEDLSQRVLRSLARGSTPIVIGGDHSVSVGSVTGASIHLREQRGPEAALGLLWIDAHADLNTGDDGNLHGRAAAILLGHGPSRLTGIGGFAPKIQAGHLIEVGVQELMPTEMDLIGRLEIDVRSIGRVEREGLHETVTSAVSRLEAEADALYLSVDIDAAAGESFGACAAPMIGGLTAREMCAAVELASGSPKFVGMDLVEFCPGRDDTGNTGRLVTNLLHAAVGYTRMIGR